MLIEIYVQSFCNKQLIETMNRTVCFVCRKAVGTGVKNQNKIQIFVIIHLRINVFSCITGMKHYYMCAVLKHRIRGSRLDICIEMCAQWGLDWQKSKWVEVKVDTEGGKAVSQTCVCRGGGGMKSGCGSWWWSSTWPVILFVKTVKWELNPEMLVFRFKYAAFRQLLLLSS